MFNTSFQGAEGGGLSRGVGCAGVKHTGRNCYFKLRLKGLGGIQEEIFPYQPDKESKI